MLTAFVQSRCNFSRQFFATQVAISNCNLETTSAARDCMMRSIRRELSLVIKFQFLLRSISDREGVHLFASGSQAATRLREKHPAANRPAKNPTNGWKKASRRSGVGYLYPDTRLIFTIHPACACKCAFLFYPHF